MENRISYNLSKPDKRNTDVKPELLLSKTFSCAQFIMEQLFHLIYSLSLNTFEILSRRETFLR